MTRYSGKGETRQKKQTTGVKVGPASYAIHSSLLISYSFPKKLHQNPRPSRSFIHRNYLGGLLGGDLGSAGTSGTSSPFGW